MTHDKGRFGPPSTEQSPDHQAVEQLLLEPTAPFAIDWQTPAHELRLPERLSRLAGLKAMLPGDNAEKEKVTHDQTLENYIRLALDSAGDRSTIDTFLHHVEATLESDKDDVQMLAQQAFWIWAPVAEVADLGDHKARLEDVALRVLRPSDYHQLERDFQAISPEQGLLKNTREEIEEVIDSLDIPPQFSYELQNRSKSKYSAWRKIQLEERDNAQIFDLMGFRVIIDGGDESMAIGQCRYILGAMEEYFESSPEWRMDYIASPKPNGYQSLHQTFTLPTGQSFELQLRTRAMHDQTKTGGALTHQAYDAMHKVVPGKVRRTFVKVPKLYRWRDEATLFMQEHGGRTEGILGDNILFFKDDGNLYLLANDATALDASYAVHSRRALKTRTIKRNGQPIEFSDTVNHGDCLGLLYHNQYPTDVSRLDRQRLIMATRNGRTAIEKYKRRLQADKLRSIGHGVISEMLPDLQIDDPLALLSEDDRSKLARGAGMPSFEKLLEIIGDGQKNGKPGRIANLIRVRSGISPIIDRERTAEKTPLSDKQVLEHIRLPNRDASPICRIAGCCSGAIRLDDPVFARPSELHHGVMQLHRTDCNNVTNLEEGILCEWE
jgi:GTP pyrophosphokinase